MLVLLCGGLRLPAQQDWSWVLGDSVLMTFPNGGAPVVDSLARTRWAFESMACISDSSGELLYYTDQNFIYRADGSKPSGGIDLESYYMSNGLQFLPIWGGAGYVLFYVSYTCTQVSICPRLSVIGTVNGRDTVLQNQALGHYHPLYGPVEKVSAVRDAQGTGWWVFYHGYDDNIFIKFKVDGNKVSPLSLQPIGSIYGIVGSNASVQNGELCFSPQGDKLLMVTGSGIIDLFDFDRCSGMLSNWDSLGTLAYTYPGPNINYGCAFSPDGTKIYVAEASEAPDINHLYQFDLTAPDIRASKTLIYTLPDSVLSGALQLGPDGKIYMSQTGNYDSLNVANFYLSVINDPNQAGTACNFTYLSLWLKGLRGTAGLPNLPNYNLPPLVAQVAEAGPARKLCPGDSVRIGYPDSTGGAVTYSWSPTDGLTDSTSAYTWARPDTSTWYYLRAYDAAMGMPCGQTIDSVLVTVVLSGDLPVASLGNDTVVCLQDSVRLSVSAVSGWEYAWSTGDTTAQIWASVAGTYAVTVTNPSANLHCLVDADTMMLTIFQAPQALAAGFAGRDTVICNGDSVLIGSSAVSGWDYNWLPSGFLNSTTIAQPLAMPGASQDYALLATDSVSGGVCMQVADTVVIVVEQPFTHAMPVDVSFCVGECFVIGVEPVIGMQYAWSPVSGLTSPDMSLTKAQPLATTTYSLSITNPALQSANCRARDYTVVATADACAPASFIIENAGGMVEVLAIGAHQGQVSLQLIDYMGRLVYRNTDYQNDLSTASLASGVYLFALRIDGECPLSYEGKLLVLR